MGEEVHHRVGDRQRILPAGRAQRLQAGRETRPARTGRHHEIRAHVAGDGRDRLRQAADRRRLGLLHQVRRRERKVVRGGADHRVLGLEALDALLLGRDRVRVRREVARQPVRQVRDLPHRRRQVLLEAVHAGNEQGQGVEIGQRVGLHAGGLDAPLGRELLDLPQEGQGRAVLGLGSSAPAQRVQGADRGQREDGDGRPEDDGPELHGDSSSDSPTRVSMNATIASLSSSGASRPNWNSNMASTASRRVSALPSCR